MSLATGHRFLLTVLLMGICSITLISSSNAGVLRLVEQDNSPPELEYFARGVADLAIRVRFFRDPPDEGPRLFQVLVTENARGAWLADDRFTRENCDIYSHSGSEPDIRCIFGSRWPPSIHVNLEGAESGGRSYNLVRLNTPTEQFMHGRTEVIGSDRRDIVFGSAGRDRIDGAGGDDILRGGSNQDRIIGGDGDDLLQGGANDDTLRAGAGNDHLVGGPGDDQEYGDAGSDTLETIEAPPTNTEEDPTAGDDSLHGGPDADIAAYQSLYGPMNFHITVAGSNSGGTVTQNFTRATSSGNALFIDSLEDVERVNGTPGPDVFRTNELEVSGLAGDDLFFVDNGRTDTVSCGAGTDTVEADPEDSTSAECDNVHMRFREEAALAAL